MPVQTPHPEYESRKTQWQRCQDAFEGQDRVKARTLKDEAYLRKLPGMDDQTTEAKRSWERYVDRALWFNASRRTMRAMTGFVFRKEPVEVWPNTAMQEAMRDVTLGGVHLRAFARRVVSQQIQAGRYGILVDFDEQERRPRFCGYPASKILNWRERVVSGRRELAEVRLLEASPAMPDPDDPAWGVIRLRQIRVIQMTDSGPLVRVFVEDPKAETEADRFKEDEEQTVFMNRNGEPLEFIPFVFVNVSHNEADPESPPLLDLVDANVDHFKLDANYKLGLEKCGIPILYAAGFSFGETSDIEPDGRGDDMNDKVAISPDYMLHTEKEQGKVAYAEFSGQGLTPLKEERESDEDRMAVLGARILEQPKAGVEAAATLEARHSGEKSALGDMVTTAEDGIVAALGMFAWWMRWVDDPAPPRDNLNYVLNKDFVSTRMTPQMLREWTSSLLSGTISYATYYHVLEEGELTRPGVSAEDEQEEMDIEEPIDTPGTDNDGGNGRPVQRLPQRPTVRTSG